jgi:PAS domain S-box-containing protein
MWQAMIENASDMVTLIGADGRILYQSPSVERVLGWKPEEFEGTFSHSWNHPDDLPRLMDDVTRAINDAQAPHEPREDGDPDEDGDSQRPGLLAPRRSRNTTAASTAVELPFRAWTSRRSQRRLRRATAGGSLWRGRRRRFRRAGVSRGCHRRACQFALRIASGTATGRGGASKRSA